MEISERVSNKWNGLSKTEKAGLKVLILFVLGVIIFFFGIGIGEAFYGIFGK